MKNFWLNNLKFIISFIIICIVSIVIEYSLIPVLFFLVVDSDFACTYWGEVYLIWTASCIVNNLFMYYLVGRFILRDTGKTILNLMPCLALIYPILRFILGCNKYINTNHVIIDIKIIIINAVGYLGAVVEGPVIPYIAIIATFYIMAWGLTILGLYIRIRKERKKKSAAVQEPEGS